MSKTTQCDKCIFYSEDSWCDFSIPEVISNKEILVNDQNHTIENYNCGYAFGKDTFEKNKDNITKEELRQTILEKNKINYTLILNFDTLNKTIPEILDTISTLSFKPTNLICFGKTIQGDMVAAFEKYLNIPWKANKTLPHIDEQISVVSCVDTVLEKHNSKCFLYISEFNSFSELDDLINQIHISVVINHIHGIMLYSKNSLNGLFMTYDTYKILGSDKADFFYDANKFFIKNPDCNLVLYND
jgi:hypothetical protein